MFLSAVWTLILTAPIHCRASTGDAMLYFSKSVQMKKQTHLHLGWSGYIYLASLHFGGTVPLRVLKLALNQYYIRIITSIILCVMEV